ncbi:MAG: single-stranded-DNA-specific exonuclease RecJ, partial [Planctomycetota bacterium]|jgi:single-stranded-DNA-specific exonuclease
LHPPALLPGADAAAERIVAAVRAGERIAIYGDYDVDGMTATAILTHVIRRLRPDADLMSYVPHRLEEGYGLNAPALEQLAAEGVRLVVTVDCGITARSEVAVGRAAGLDLIVTDHHELPPGGAEAMPEAILVHPRLPGSAYPNGDLCGAGVAFKLAWRIAQVWAGSDLVGQVARQALVEVLPLAALGTIADVVPLVGENRILTRFGLQTIKASPIEGLRALIEASGLMGQDIDDERAGFVLAPRLNACGRLGHARDAVRLLCDATGEEAARIAGMLARLNAERQKTERGITEQAAAMAESEGMTGDDRRAIVLADAQWHPGVVGIVCSRLVERFGRPVVLLQRGDDGMLKGSARSIDGYSIHAGLEACSAHLERFGGHEAAAGLTLRAERFEAFREALLRHAGEHIRPEQLVPSLRMDVDAVLRELTPEAVRAVRRLGPFGRGNPRPVVRLGGVQITDARRMGGDLRHLSLEIRDPRDGAGGGRLRAVWFGGGEHAAALVPGRRIDLAVEPRVDRWRGRERVEAHVRDVRLMDRE